MEKIKITIPLIQGIHFNKNIDDVIEMLNQFKSEYSAKGYFDLEIDEEFHTIGESRNVLFGTRYETDDEYNDRMNP
jgi:hypothetical protein